MSLTSKCPEAKATAGGVETGSMKRVGAADGARDHQVQGVHPQTDGLGPAVRDEDRNRGRQRNHTRGGDAEESEGHGERWGDGRRARDVRRGMHGVDREQGKQTRR